MNTAGYWDLLLQMFDRMRQQLFIRPELETRYIVVDDVEQVVPEFLKRRPAKRTTAPHLIRA